MLNVRDKVAILRGSATYRKNSKATRSRRGWGSDKLGGTLYFKSYTSIAKSVPEFFKHHPDYALLIELCTSVHTTVMYIVKAADGASLPYAIYAFDPNRTCNSLGFVELTKMIQKTTGTIPVWTSANDNYDGVCFGLAWRFIFAVMNEGYKPIANEPIWCLYNMSRKRAIVYQPSPTEAKQRRRGIGYSRVRSKGCCYQFVRRGAATSV